MAPSVTIWLGFVNRDLHLLQPLKLRRSTVWSRHHPSPRYMPSVGLLTLKGWGGTPPAQTTGAGNLLLLLEQRAALFLEKLLAGEFIKWSGHLQNVHLRFWCTVGYVVWIVCLCVGLTWWFVLYACAIYMLLCLLQFSLTFCKHGLKVPASVAVQALTIPEADTIFAAWIIFRCWNHHDIPYINCLHVCCRLY